MGATKMQVQIFALATGSGLCNHLCMEKLIAYIAENGLTQKEFAKKIGVSDATMCRMLKPGYDYAGMATSRAIAIEKATRRKVKLADLIGGAS